jgi:protein involved in polysaccharide export with SLBB domain
MISSKGGPHREPLRKTLRSRTITLSDRGDRLTIYLWGNVEHAYPVSVKRDGSVTIPRVGNLVIGGMSLAKTKTFLRNKFKTFYPDFEMNVIMDKLRSIHVYIVGEAVNPGSYTLNALSTVMSALSVSGGPEQKGQPEENPRAALRRRAGWNRSL